MKRRLVTLGLIMMLVSSLALLMSPQVALAAGTIYVDHEAPGPTYDGSSWENAFLDLQSALAAAVSDDEIWVAEGTYKPGTGITDSFSMINNVGIYGGFDPTTGDITWEDRDWEANVTILSGDLDDDDIPGDFTTNRTDNCHHVFFHDRISSGPSLNSTAVLDGFTISGGNADGSDIHTYGGGMCNLGPFTYRCEPTVTNCTFYNNSAEVFGGGMYNMGSSVHPTTAPTVTNCTFNSNHAGYAGGGMLNYDCSPAVITNCIFNDNTAKLWGGGGMFNGNSSPKVTNCIFSGNQKTAPSNSESYSGGGMFNGNSSPEVTNCTFYNNSATHGGGMDNRVSSSPIVTNCILWGNTAESEGNQIYIDSSSPVVTYCNIDQDGFGTVPDGNPDGNHNIRKAPLLYDPLNYDFRLTASSPCIDAGNDAAVPVEVTHDINGDGRILDGPDSDSVAVVDMGSDEFPISGGPEAPVPDLPTVILLGLGLLGLGGFIFWRRRRAISHTSSV